MICIVVKKNCLLDMIAIQSILRLLFFHFDISRKLGELECLFIIESYCSSYDGNKFVETNLIGINSPWNSNLAWRKLRNLMKITKIHWVYYVIVWYWCLLNRYIYLTIIFFECTMKKDHFMVNILYSLFKWLQWYFIWW